LIDVNMNYFRAAAECQSTEETRYYLNGVYVAPHPEKGVLLTATDGHRLITLHDETGKCSAPKIVKIDPKAIDAKTYNALLKSMSIEEAPRIVVDDDGIVTAGTYRSLKSCFIDGTFPDWARVVKPVLDQAKEGKYCPASYNQKYVAAFGRIATMLSPDNNQSASIRIISFSESDPSLIRFGNINCAFGILMPIRVASSNEIPIWMKPILEPTPAPAVAPAAAPKAQAKAKKRPVARRVVAKRKPSKPIKKAAKRRAA
jgi:hypothetical protein